MEEVNFEMGVDVMSALKSSTKKMTIVKELDPFKEIPTALEQNRPCTLISTPSLRVNGNAIQDSFEKYLSHPGIQSSNLKQALITPFHFQYSREDDKQKLVEIQGEKKHFQLGTFIHQCILEPRKFGRVIVEPKNSMTSTEGVNAAIEFWENIIRSEEDDHERLILDAIMSVHEKGLNIDKIDGKRFYLEMLKSKTDIQPVSEEHYFKIKIMEKHLENYGNGVIKKLVKGSKREISFYYNHPNGLSLKVRPDAIAFEENIGVNAIISIKSTACEDLRAFVYQNAKLNYDLSEAMYQDVVSNVTGRRFNTTITIMLQTIEPFAIAVLIWKKDDIEVGLYKYESAMEKVLLAKEQGQYKGYDSYADNDNGLILMELPQWNNKELLPSI